MRQGLGILVPDGRKVPQPHAAVSRAFVFLSAVDRYIVAAFGEPPRELFGEGFEAAVARRNAARPENRNSHRMPIRTRIAALAILRRSGSARGSRRQVSAPAGS